MRTVMTLLTVLGIVAFATSCGDNEQALASKDDPGETAIFHPDPYNIPYFLCDYNNDSGAQSFCHQEGYYKALDYSCRTINRVILDDQGNVIQIYYFTIMDSIVCWRP